MKIEIFDQHKNVTSAVVSTNGLGMLSVLINMASKAHTCSYQGSSVNLIAQDDTDGAVPKHACFRVSPEGVEDSNCDAEVVVIAETPAEDLLLAGLHYESQCKDQHQIIFVPRSMLAWQQLALASTA
jgi:hypothetical protein